MGSKPRPRSRFFCIRCGYHFTERVSRGGVSCPRCQSTLLRETRPDGSRIDPPTNMGFCASCLEESDDLELDASDGRLHWLCKDCARGSLRSGRWHFDEAPPEPMRPLPGKGND